VKATLAQPRRSAVGAGGVGQRVGVARLRDVVVLAEPTAEVAAGCPEGQHAGAGIKVRQRLLLDRVDAEAGRSAVGGQHHGVVDPLAHEAEPALAGLQGALARAQVALDPAVR
jgi:hypothetical protein